MEADSPIQRRCPVCQGDESTAHWQKGHFRTQRCRRCAMVFANPVDLELVSGEFYGRRGETYYLSPEKLESDYAPVRFRRELRLFRKYCLCGDVLDVGCSTGGFLIQLSRTSPEYAVTGLDVVGAALDHAAQQGIGVIRQPFLEHRFEDRRYDAVTFWAVLEHLVEPRPFLEKAATVLRPGGFCFVLVPNLDSLAVRLLGPKYRYVTAEHVNYFTGSTLHALVATISSFEITAVRSTHFNPVVIWQDWMGKGDPVPDKERARLLRRTTRLKGSPWLRPVAWAYTAVERFLGAAGLADNLVMVLRRR